MQGTDLDESLEYLREIRQTVILFINVVTLKIDIDKFFSFLPKGLWKTCKDALIKCQYSIKTWWFWSAVGLRCGLECRQLILTVDNVKTTSIAVTIDWAAPL